MRRSSLIDKRWWKLPLLNYPYIEFRQKLIFQAEKCLFQKRTRDYTFRQCTQIIFHDRDNQSKFVISIIKAHINLLALIKTAKATNR